MKIALEIIPAHRTIDDGYSRFMYAIVNAVLARNTRHEFLVILGPDGNESFITPSVRATVVRCKPGNRNLNQQFSAARLARAWGADVLHNFGAPASLFWGKPLILTIHDVAIVAQPELFPKRWVWYQRYTYAALKKKNPLVVTVSEFSKSEIVKYFRFPADRIHVVYPIPFHAPRAVGTDEQDRTRAQLSLPQKYFLYVGILEPRKNLVRLVHAFEQYRAHGGDAALVLGGRMGWKSAELQDAIRVSPAAEHIHLPGFLSDEQLPGVISAAHAFVYPSLYEGFGIPPVEALMFDVPVLSSTAASLPEVLGDAALLVDPLDTDVIAAGLRRIDDDTALRTDLVARGRLRRARYGADASAAAVLSLYDLIR